MLGGIQAWRSRGVLKGVQMDLDRLWSVADVARGKAKLSQDDREFIREEVPHQFAGFPQIELPKKVRHPAGFTVSGAPVVTFTRSALLLAGRRVLGKRYDAVPFYLQAEKDLAFGIMRSHFHHGYPKGTYCCTQCTLAVYPVLKANAIKYFDCTPLAEEVHRIIERGEWRFARSPNAKMLAWSLGETPRAS
jgi:hypothetical protein